MIFVAIFLYLAGAFSTFFWVSVLLFEGGLPPRRWKMAFIVLIWPFAVPVALYAGVVK